MSSYQSEGKQHSFQSTALQLESTRTHLELMLERAFEMKKNVVHLTGTSSPTALAFSLSQSISKDIDILPHLVIFSSYDDQLAFIESLETFGSHRSVVSMPAPDVSPYSGLFPSPKTQHEKINFFVQAQRAQGGDIFVTTIESLLHKGLPFKVLNENTKTYRVGDDLPEDLSSYLSALGYESAPLVEDVGQYSMRGGIIDLFPPTSKTPIRIELFGDTIESLRAFQTSDQRSLHELNSFILAPAIECFFDDDSHEALLKRTHSYFEKHGLKGSEVEETLRSLVQKNHFPSLEFFLPLFHSHLETVVDHFSSPLNAWLVDPVEISRAADEFLSEMKADLQNTTGLVRFNNSDYFQNFEELSFPDDSRKIFLSNLEYLHEESPEEFRSSYRTLALSDFTRLTSSHAPGGENWLSSAEPKFRSWKEDRFRIFVFCKNKVQIDRTALLIEKLGFTAHKTDESQRLWDTWLHTQGENEIFLLSGHLNETIRIDEEKIIFLRDDDFFGVKKRASRASQYEDFHKQAQRLSFGDLKPGDLVVHIKHGVGIYEGLKVMPIGGVESEFIQLSYKDKDKLYLPVYRVGQLQKFSGTQSTGVLDKLGGTGWEKTKGKVKKVLKDIAAELLQLYAKRTEISRTPFEILDQSYAKFERGFPYEETPDQNRAILDLIKDFRSTKPMDRLICGDVGFGKTEVAMRACFFVADNGKQVAVLAPTTVLTFQHFETFKKRFAGLNIEIRALNRFVSTADAKKTLQDLKDGKVHILIGTHRLLSKDVVFKDLGLLVIDEEQKFGVTHKERIRKLKNNVDTLTLSATPIPRTLNMSFSGIRDLSIINTAPIDRLPTRTFISKFEPETIRKAVNSEISRGGQIYFIHNRVQSIYGLADELREILPGVRMRVAHGQMNEDELEGAMLAFFNHEIDMLVCTAIVESGMDVPRANTMFIDQAHMFGLSQLYQLRGRVGRSKARAYCYLLMPKDRKLEPQAQERLKIIQDNTALGSGIKIAQYDLELRGAGNLLGEDQSGHVNSVGYEMYMDLLNEALSEARGEPTDDRELDPEVNLRIAAMIPDNYISDIRLRLSYYKALAQIESADDLTKIEEELKDQFGALPEPTVNLMGLMLIRRQCKELGVRDVSAGLKNISLIFTEKTKLKPETVIQLAMRENKKYSLTPDQRLNIRMNSITWSNVYEELEYLLKLI